MDVSDGRLTVYLLIIISAKSFAIDEVYNGHTFSAYYYMRKALICNVNTS
jgi:hypothetical protein